MNMRRGKPENNDAIVCDDMTINTGGGNWPAIGLLALSAFLGYKLLDKPQLQPQSQPQPHVAKELLDVKRKFDVLIFDSKGELIDVQPLPKDFEVKE